MATLTDVIALANGETRLTLLPELGGAVGRFAWRGRDVLRPTPGGAKQVLETSSFALVPFANRIAQGCFRFDGRAVRLASNLAGDPHALHGQGWLSPWRIVKQDADRAVLAFSHAAGEWPWAYETEQCFTMTGNGLRVELRVTNRDERPMPVSLGFHPYFPKTAATRLTAKLSGVWLSDDTLIPSRVAEASHFLDTSRGAALADAPFVDHCHIGFEGAALIEQDDIGVAMTAGPELRFLHLYIPGDADFFCAEPVSAMPDAFNRDGDTGMAILAPGATTDIWMELAVSER